MAPSLRIISVCQINPNAVSVPQKIAVVNSKIFVFGLLSEIYGRNFNATFLSRRERYEKRRRPDEEVRLRQEIKDLALRHPRL